MYTLSEISKRSETFARSALGGDSIKGFKEVSGFDCKKPIHYTCISGNVVDVVSLPHIRKHIAYNVKLDADNYLQCATGEIRQYNHAKNKSESVQSVYRTLKKLRRVINANVTDIKNIRWVTLTYAENMTDTERLYEDFRKFNMRLKYYVEHKYHTSYEYICCCEPQGRGAWHMHLIYIFDYVAPYIPNKELAEIWRYGFVSIKALKSDIDNIGAYLTAYLSDLEINPSDVDKYNGYEIKTLEEDGKSKAFIKGARMVYYPSGFQLFRCSRGIKRPKKEVLNDYDLKKIVGSPQPTIFFKS